MNKVLSGGVAALAAVVALSSFVSIARADWQEPKDGLVTDKQVANYVEATKEIYQNLKAAGKAIDGTGNAFTAARVLQAADEKTKATIARHGMTEPEYRWVGERVWEARGQLFMDETLSKAEADVANRLKKSADDQAAMKQKLAAYAQAAKAGRRVMSADERAEAVKAAQADRQSADEEAKQHADAVKEAPAEAAKADAEAKAADAAAKSPPRDLTGDDRQAFVDEKKQAAETARGMAKEARDREAEERKALAEAKAKSAAAAARAQNPDLPTTDDERAEAKKQNEEAVAGLKADLQTAAQADQFLRDAAEQNRKQLAEERAKPAAKNAAVVKAHAKDFDAIWQQK